MSEQIFNVVEHFASINGEGVRAGELAVFVRFRGCNLDCSYCDTRWANDVNAKAAKMSVSDIVKAVEDVKIDNVTLTGGEPLIQAGIDKLIAQLPPPPRLRPHHRPKIGFSPCVPGPRCSRCNHRMVYRRSAERWCPAECSMRQHKPSGRAYFPRSGERLEVSPAPEWTTGQSFRKGWARASVRRRQETVPASLWRAAFRRRSVRRREKYRS